MNSCVTASVHPAPVGCHEGAICPAGWADLTSYALRDVDQVALRWSHRPYTVLLVTGVTADVLELPAAVGEMLLRHLRLTGQPAVAAHSAGRVLVFAAASRPVDPDRAGAWLRVGVVFHQRRSWVVLPPSVVDGVRTRWASRLPRTGRIPLPEADPLLPLLDRSCPPPPRPARGVVAMPTLVLPHHADHLGVKGHQLNAETGRRSR